MPDQSMLLTQGAAQGQARAEDAARRIEDAVAKTLEAQAKALEAQAAAEAGGAQGGAATTEAEVIRIGPGGEITRVGPGEEAAVAGETAQPPDELPPFLFEPQIPDGVVAISIAFFVMLAVIIVGLPIARAWARRMDRNTAAPAGPSAAQAEQLRHIQTAVDAMAVEVERISENQRYVTRLLAEGAPRPEALPVREPAREESGRP
jgi:hypothetical protein